MILIKPVTITDSNLTSSIPEPDATAGEVEWAAGTYNLGDRVIKSSTHLEYEVVADQSTTDDPEVGVLADPQTWVVVGPTNRFKMFDEANNTSSVSTDLTVEIVPGDLVNSVACFNVNCEDITINAYDQGGALVYTKNIEMRSRPLVNGWYNYFYSGIDTINKFVTLDVPPTTNGKVEIIFTGTDASVGTCIAGKQLVIGDAQYGTSAELLDFSNPIEDKFGNITYTDGFTAKLVNFDILANTKDIDPIFVEFQTLGKTNAVFVGNPEEIGDSTLVYGYVRDFNPVYSSPSKSQISLTVRGLV